MVESNFGSGGPDAIFEVSLSKASTEEVRVDYRTIVGTAIEADFWSGFGTGTLVIAAGETTGLIQLRVLGDTAEEVDEAFWLELFNPENGVLAGGGTTLRSIGVIRDDDGTGSDLGLFVSSPTLVEGNTGQSTAVFEIHLSEPHTQALTFNYRTVDGSAKAGSDYVGKTGSVTFLAGQTVATVEVKVNGDGLSEPSEFFSLVVSPTAAISNGTSASTGVATVLDNDAGRPPTISVSRVDVVESNSGSSGPNATFEVTLSKASTEEVRVDYRTLIGTAVEADFWSGFGTGTLVIAAGETTGLIQLRVLGDTADEADEAFWLELFNPENGVLAGGGTTLRSIGVIRDDDGSGSDLGLFVSSPTLVEGNKGQSTAVFEIHLSEPHTQALTFNYRTADGSAKAGGDYVAKTGSVTFLAGQTVATVEVQVKGDGLSEPSEVFSLVVTPTAAIRNGTSASTGVATVLDDDAGGRPTISVSRVDVLESNSGSAGPNATFEVSLSKASTEEVRVDYRTLIGTAVEADFWSGFGTGTLVIAAGETTGLIQLRVLGDTVDEVDEAFWLELFNPENGVLAGGGTTLRSIGVIRDDDGTGSDLGLFVSSPTLVEGNKGQSTAVFEIHLSEPHDKALTFNYRTADGSAKAGSDYVAKTGSVTFLAGQTLATVEVQVKGDGLSELSEVFSLVVSPTAAIRNGTSASTGVATVLDNDSGGRPSISISRVDVLESNSGSAGPNATFEVTLSKASTEEVRVDYRTLIGTAVEADFWSGFGTGTLVIAAGETTGLIQLRVLGDTVDEVDEAFWLELFNPENAVLAGGGTTLRSIGVIRDDDGTGSDLGLFVSSPTLLEGNKGQSTAVFEIHLSEPHDKALTFNYRTADGSAKAGSDYVAKTGSVTFLAGQTVATVEVQVKGDGLNELSEVFSLVVKPTAAIRNGRDAHTGVATILNDDPIHEVIRGTAGKDVIRGLDGNDTLFGLGGADKLFGGSGLDSLTGGEGADSLYGEAGKDKLYGQAGRDLLTGGGQADTFIFKHVSESTTATRGRDVIADFSRQQGDKIDLAAIDADDARAGNNPFTFIGSADFSAKAGELRFETRQASTFVHGDTDGDAVADFSIALKGALDLLAKDFLL